MKIVIHQELYSSKNSRQFVRLRNGRTVLLKSKRAQEQEDTLEEALDKQMARWMEMADGKEFPIKVHFTVYRKTKRRWDWMNMIQGLADAMVEAGYIPDDSAEFFTPVFEEALQDKNDPRVEFWVE